MTEIKLNFNQGEEGKIILADQLPKPSAQTILPSAEPPTVTLPTYKIIGLKNLAENLLNNARQLSDLLANELAPVKPTALQTMPQTLTDTPALENLPEGQVIEGIFDGEKMSTDRGQRYDVPPNYASKSKLVEGDRLKLLISPSGSFIYKQIQPVERKRLTGILTEADDGRYHVVVDDQSWLLLNAAVSYFHGATGDEI